MDINEEAENVVRDKAIEERVKTREIEEENTEYRNEQVRKSEILKAKRSGLVKAYKLARTHNMWEQSHDLLMEIMREYYETVQADTEATGEQGTFLPPDISEILYRWR